MDPPPQNPPQDQVESTESKAKVHTSYTGGKILILSKKSHVEILNFPKIHCKDQNFVTIQLSRNFQNYLFEQNNQSCSGSATIHTSIICYLFECSNPIPTYGFALGHPLWFSVFSYHPSTRTRYIFEVVVLPRFHQHVGTILE